MLQGKRFIEQKVGVWNILVCYMVLVIYIFTIIKIIKVGKTVSKETSTSQEFLINLIVRD